MRGMLQKQEKRVILWVLEIYQSYTPFKHVPHIEGMCMVSIPKADRRGNKSTKNFRRIRLTSFVLKTLKILLVVIIAKQIHKVRFSRGN